MNLDIRSQIAAARDQLHQAAEAIRALSDAELLALVSGPMAEGMAKPPHVAAPPKRAPRKAVPAAPKKTIEDVAKKHVQSPAGTTKYDEGVLSVLAERGPTGPAELARLVGAAHTGAVFHTLKNLLAAKVIVKQGSGRGSTFYALTPVRAARQTGAKAKPKATRAPAADDEEGAAVQAAPVPVLASAAIHRAPTSLLARPRAVPLVPVARRAEVPIADAIASAADVGDEVAPLPDDVGLEVGFGQRRNTCRHYDSCLSRFIRTHSARIPEGQKEPPARCPAGCAHYAAPPRDAQIQLAMRGGRSPLAAAATN